MYTTVVSLVANNFNLYSFDAPNMKLVLYFYMYIMYSEVKIFHPNLKSSSSQTLICRASAMWQELQTEVD